ncbi:MAG TPA: hypothetical protein VEA69_20325 [Tepidisphaeraceae bacterium]|nr:hypothetical protein [Tepidisphaeraceae bacterium]
MDRPAGYHRLTARWNVRRLGDEIEEWVGREEIRRRFCDDPRRELGEWVAVPLADAGRTRLARFRVSTLATWHRWAGFAAVLGGDLGGWASVALACRYQCAALTARLRMFAVGKETFLAGDEHLAGLAVCDSIVFGDDGGDALCAQLAAYLAGPERVGNGFRSAERFPAFAVALHRVWRGRSSQAAEAEGLGKVYGGLLRSWADDAAFAAAASAACDYHCANITQERDGEFFWYALFPTEIVATFRVRAASLGRPGPPISHPLLDGPLAGPPADVKAPPDPLLDVVAPWIGAGVEHVLANPGRRRR